MAEELGKPYGWLGNWPDNVLEIARILARDSRRNAFQTVAMLNSLNLYLRMAAEGENFYEYFWAMIEATATGINFYRLHLEQMGREVRDKTQSMGIGPNHIPFVLVVPTTLETILSQMKTLKQGNCELELSRFTDLVGTPSSPYLIFDVGAEAVSEEKPLLAVQQEIEASGRRGLTTVEIIAIYRYLHVMNVAALGSRIIPPVGKTMWKNRVPVIESDSNMASLEDLSEDATQACISGDLLAGSCSREVMEIPVNYDPQ